MTSIFQYDSGLAYDTDQPYDPYNPSTTPTVNLPITHLSTQMALGADGSFLAWTQDTLDEVAQCVEVICGTPQGQRTVQPNFGLPQQPFDGPNKNDFITAINAYENRANYSVAITPTASGVGAVSVSVELASSSS